MNVPRILFSFYNKNHHPEWENALNWINSASYSHIFFFKMNFLAAYIVSRKNDYNDQIVGI